MIANITQFNFTNITSGYVGIKANKATLNSAYYAEFFSRHLDLNTEIILPQCIPKIGFFEEILSHENTQAAQLLDQKRLDLLQHSSEQYNAILILQPFNGQ